MNLKPLWQQVIEDVLVVMFIVLIVASLFMML